VTRTDRLVVRVEEVRERGIERCVALDVRREEERLEEPGGVRPMPFRRAHVGHGLDDLVFFGEGGGEVVAVAADPAVVLVEGDAFGGVEGGAGCEGGHLSTVPKQAATHDVLRTGAVHSTMPVFGPIIGISFRAGGRVYGTTRGRGSCRASSGHSEEPTGVDVTVPMR
jgi:hypothetical protein